MTPTVDERRVLKARAALFKTNPSSAAAFMTAVRVSGRTFSGWFSVRETVAMETPASRATSWAIGRRALLAEGLLSCLDKGHPVLIQRAIE